jgi:hypothetical protein
MDDLAAFPVIDGHCHPFDPATPPREEDWLRFEQPEGDGVGETLLRMAARAWAGGMKGDAAALFADARIVGQVVDPGWPELPFGMDRYAEIAPARVKLLQRIEHLCDEALAEGDGDVRDAAERVRHLTLAALASGKIAGLKSVIAYETGLDIRPPDRERAQEALAAGLPRQQSKALNEYLAHAAVRAAAEAGAVVQFHTGIGARFLPAHQESPWQLLGLLEQGWLRGGRIVILHAGYPHLTAAGRLVGIFPNVYCDLSILFPYSYPACSARLRELLAFAPPGRLTFGSDGCFEPERYWIAAKLAKQALAEVLGDLVRDGAMTASDALRLAEGMLHDTSARLYGFPS